MLVADMLNEGLLLRDENIFMSVCLMINCHKTQQINLRLGGYISKIFGLSCIIVKFD